MTLIAGLNLSDRLYLLADSRVTVNKNIKIDNVCKIMPIYGKNVLDYPCDNDNYISLAVAGNLEFANFLYQEISKAFKNKELSGDIRELYTDIDKFIKPKVDYWLSTLKKDYKKHCCLLFAGSCNDRNKKIDLRKLKELVNTFNRISDEERKTSAPLMEDALKKDETLQLLNKRLLEDAKKDIFTLLEESRKPKIKPFIQKAIDDSTNELNGFSDSLIFCILIKPSETEGYKKESAEWGEFLFYGTNGISKEDASEELLVKLELSDFSKNKDHLIEAPILDAEVKYLAKNRGLGKIGGITLVNAIKDCDSKIIPCQNGSFFSNGKLYIKLLGNNVPVVTFTKCHEAISKMGQGVGSAEL